MFHEDTLMSRLKTIAGLTAYVYERIQFRFLCLKKSPCTTLCSFLMLFMLRSNIMLAFLQIMRPHCCPHAIRDRENQTYDWDTFQKGSSETKCAILPLAFLHEYSNLVFIHLLGRKVLTVQIMSRSKTFEPCGDENSDKRIKVERQ